MTGGSGDRRGSGGPFEVRWGYSRVVRVGPLAVTAGCTATVDGVVQAPGDAGRQARIALDVAVRALADVGIGVQDVIASRMSIVDAADQDAVGLAHAEVFAGIRPAATMVVVAGLVDPAMLVEIELTAWRESPSPSSSGR